jgi:hypothetical protein
MDRYLWHRWSDRCPLRRAFLRLTPLKGLTYNPSRWRRNRQSWSPCSCIRPWESPGVSTGCSSKGFLFVSRRLCFKSLSGSGWHGVTGGSRRGGCPAVRCRPVCTTLLRSGLGRERTEDAGAGVGRQWGTCSLGRSGDVGSRAVADAGISGKSGSGSSCLDSHPNRETSLGSIFGMCLGSLRWT